MHHKSKQQATRGFTLVELMLAMAFFASILAISSTTFVQILGIYNKGLAVKQMNQAGRTFTDSLIRNANQSLSNISVAPAAGANTVRCIRLGSTTYLLSYFNENGSSPSAYRFNTPGTPPVNFVRYNAPNKQCPTTNPASVVPAEVSPVIGGSLRVYYTDIAPVTADGTLLRFKIVLGTYVGDPLRDPTALGPTVTCPASSLGDFCSTSTYETVLYLPNREGGA